jgi:hypothetical protein
MEKLNVSATCGYINHVSGLLRGKDHTVIHIQEITVGPKDIRITILARRPMPFTRFTGIGM